MILKMGWCFLSSSGLASFSKEYEEINDSKALAIYCCNGCWRFIFLALNNRYCMSFGFQFYCNLPRILSGQEPSALAAS